MKIDALLNPSSPRKPDPLRSDGRDDGHDRVSQQYSSVFHPDHGHRTQEPQPAHSQPTRPVINQPQLGQVGGHHRRGTRALFPIRPARDDYTRRANEPLSNNNQAAPIDLSSEVLRRMFNWDFGDPIPKGMRLTVPPYATTLETPHKQRILVQDTESAESLRQWLATSTREPHVANRHTDPPVQPNTSSLRRMVEPQPIGFTRPISRPIYPSPSPRAIEMPPPSHPPRPAPQPVSQNKEKEDPLPNEDELIASVGKEVVLTEFEDVAAHTAKCDLCDKRNSQGMSRCMSCGWQTCHPCTVARACFRTHRAGGRLHTGPVHKNNLVLRDKAKGKKSKAKKETATQARKTGRRNACETTRRSSRKHSVASTGDASESDIEPLLGGARNFLGPLAGRISNTFGQDHVASGLSRFRDRRVDDAQEEITTEDSQTRDSDPSDPDYDPRDSDSQEQMSTMARRGRLLF